MQGTGFTERFKETIDLVVKAREDSKEAASAAVVLIAIRNGEVTTDDLHDCLTVEGDTRWFGSILGALKRRGILEQTGYTKTRRKQAHGRPISIFKLSEEWEKHWPGNWLNPKAKIMTSDDNELVFVAG